jgi:outer membrane protein OmpA-like peptidoglycan-associated protein
LADKLAADQTLRVVVNSYATAGSESADDERESKARRMSLVRAINLRQYLFSKGVKATRLDIRALGSKGANIDRIDIVQAAPIQ